MEMVNPAKGPRLRRTLNKLAGSTSHVDFSLEPVEPESPPTLQ